MDNLNTETPTQELPPNTGGAPSQPAFPSEDDYAAFTPEQRKDFLAEKPAPASAPDKDETNSTKKIASSSEDDDNEAVTVDANGAARDAKGRFVPVEAYTKVKGKLKTVNEELKTERDSRLKLEGRTDELSRIIGLLPKTEQAKPAEAQAPAEAPDPEVDVIGALKHALERQSALEKRLDQGNQQSQAKDAHSQLISDYATDVKGALKDHPDLGDAYGHLKNVQRAILTARGITDPNTQEVLLEKAERDLVADILKTKGSPARAIYSIAVAQGYQKKAPVAGQQPQQQQTPAKTEAERKLETLNENMAAVGSLSSASGTGTASEQIDITKLSEDEVHDLKKRLGAARWNKLLGA